MFCLARWLYLNGTDASWLTVHCAYVHHTCCARMRIVFWILFKPYNEENTLLLARKLNSIASKYTHPNRWNLFDENAFATHYTLGHTVHSAHIHAYKWFCLGPTKNFMLSQNGVFQGNVYSLHGTTFVVRLTSRQW